MEYIFFNNWAGILRVAVTTIFAYFTVIVILRISGKRTLAKMNAFDFVVTIALGSVLGAIILNKSIPLAEGILAIILLVLLQYGLTYLSARNENFKQLISNQPTLLFYKNNLLEDEMVKQRISREEINKAVREGGFHSFEGVEMIILETTGDLSVIGKKETSFDPALLQGVENFREVKS